MVRRFKGSIDYPRLGEVCIVDLEKVDVIVFGGCTIYGTWPARAKYPVRNCRYSRNSSAMADIGTASPVAAANIDGFSTFRFFKTLYTTKATINVARAIAEE